MDDTELNDSWRMYFHEPSNDSYEHADYEPLADIATVQPVGMFFLMRRGVFPTWDDPSNLAGGCISLKVPRANVAAVWMDLACKMLGESLVAPPKNDTDDNNTTTESSHQSSHHDRCAAIVNGISASPKRAFCIIKVWLRTGGNLADPRNFVLPAPPLIEGVPMYTSNAENLSKTYTNNNNNNAPIPSRVK